MASVSPSSTRARLAVEFGGAFAFTFAAAGAGVADRLSGSTVGVTPQALAPALVVLAWVYAFGNISGAHLNPAVTAGFCFRGDFPWSWLPAYWAAQLAGAVTAGVVLRLSLGATAALGGVTTPHHIGDAAAFAIEATLGFLLVSVVLGTATRDRLVGPQAALAVSATIALGGLVANALTDGAMNPARSIGPALATGHLQHLWVYVAGPFTGMALALAFVLLTHGPRDPAEEEAAGAGGKQAARTG